MVKFHRISCKKTAISYTKNSAISQGDNTMDNEQFFYYMVAGFFSVIILLVCFIGIYTDKNKKNKKP